MGLAFFIALAAAVGAFWGVIAARAVSAWGVRRAFKAMSKAAAAPAPLPPPESDCG